MRRARSDYPCARCEAMVYRDERIAGVQVGDVMRWVHLDCAEPVRTLLSSPRVAPMASRGSLGATPPAVQRASLAQARAQLDVMRRRLDGQ